MSVDTSEQSHHFQRAFAAYEDNTPEAPRAAADNAPSTPADHTPARVLDDPYPQETYAIQAEELPGHSDAILDPMAEAPGEDASGSALIILHSYENNMLLIDLFYSASCYQWCDSAKRYA